MNYDKDLDLRWYRAADNVHEPLVQVVRNIVERGGTTRRTWLRAMRATYLDEPLAAEQKTLLAELSYEPIEIRTPWPALRNGVDSMHSKVAKTHPRARVLTIDGDYDLQNRAELLTQWIDGEWERLTLAEQTERVWLDCLLYGTGAVYVYNRMGEPHTERCWVGDLFVDPLEQLHDAVRSLYRTRAIDRDVLCEMFPEHKAEIAKAKPMPHDPRLPVTMHGETSDMVDVVEAWRLADGRKGKGRHVIAMDGVTLLDDRKWSGKRFPFAFVHWSRDPEAFFGIGLVEQMLAPQSELDAIARTNSEARHLFVPQLHMEDTGDGTGLQVQQLDNTVGRVYLRKPGTSVPVLLTPGPIWNDAALLEETYIQRVYNLVGLSQLSVSSQKPDGLNSGVAISNFTDVESERFATAGRSWERLHIDIAKLLVDIAEEIVASDEDAADKLEVMGGRDALETVKYSEARFADQPHVIRAFPVSQLSNSLSAKISEVVSMMEGGLVPDIDDARELADIPDIKRYQSVESAGRRLVKKVIDRALKKGEATPPNPYMPLDFLVRYGTLMASLAQEQGADDDRIQVVRDMVQMAIGLQQSLAPPPADPSMMGGAPPSLPPDPTGAPMPPSPAASMPIG